MDDESLGRVLTQFSKKKGEDLTWAAIFKSLAGVPAVLTGSREDLLWTTDMSHRPQLI